MQCFLRELPVLLPVAASEMTAACESQMSRDRSDSLQVVRITAVGIQQQLPSQIEADRSLKIQRSLTEMLLTAFEQGGARLKQDRTEFLHGELLVGMT